jgi:hypothetical protein
MVSSVNSSQIRCTICTPVGSSNAANPLSRAVNPIPTLAACRLAYSLPLMHSRAV